MKRSDKKQVYGDCMRIVRVPFAIYAVNECAEGLLTVFTASLLGSFADAVFSLDFSFALSNLWRLALCLAATIFLLPVIDIVGEIYDLKYALVYDRLLMSRYLDKEYADAMKYDAGEIAKRLEDDGIDFRCNLCAIITSLAMLPVTTAALLYLALPVSPLFTAIVFAVSLIKLTVPLAVKKLEQKYDRQKREYNTEVRQYENEITEKPCVVKMLGITAPLVERLDVLFEKYRRATLSKSILCSRLAGGISALLDTLCTVIILLAGAAFVARGAMTPGSVAAMVGYFSVFNTLISNVSSVIRTLPIMSNVTDRLSVFYEHPEDTRGEEISDIQSITASDVGFSYNGEPVIDGLAFDIRGGGKTAVAGENGSGKSTLLKLLCGLLKGYTGELLFNGRDMRSISVLSLRSRLAYASQEPFIFKGSVRENIRLGRPEAVDSEIDAIAASLGITALCGREIKSGDELSGGEKQKISIARALLKNTKLLLLDEPGNSLDAESRLWLESFIKSCDKTVIYILHDDALTSCADYVVRMRR